MSRKKIIAIVLASVFGAGIIIMAVFVGLYFTHEPVEEYRTVGYILGRTVNDSENMDAVPSTLTHVLFAFASVNDDPVPRLTEDDAKALEKLSAYMRENMPSAKLMLSINGTGMCNATRTSAKRAQLIAGLAELKEQYDLDGFDVDWEYPNRPSNKHCIHDASDYAALLEDMREAFGKDTLLSIAMCGSITYMNDLNRARMAKTLDFVNVMTYDLSLRNHCKLSDTAMSMFNASLAGFKKSQLNLGLPFYERCKDADYDYKEYDELMQMIEDGEIKLQVKDDFCFANYEGHRLSFDDRDHLMKKVELVKKRGYGGVFCWHLGCNMDGSLMREAHDILSK